MKKVLFLILCFFASIGVVNASSIEYVDMDIVLDEYGTATITETWKAYVNGGTEGWHPYYNLGNASIEVVSASMDGKKYTIEDNWNENASISKKAYKTGLYVVNDNEVDVVFGISEYGNHTYEFIYKITNFVSNLTDSDMIYWQLFPYDFSMQPGNVTIKISGPYEYPDTLDVWGYGMYGAPCYVKDGAIYMTSDGYISSSEYLTLLAKFPAGTFKTTSQLDNDFEYYHNMAEEGAEVYKDETYKEDNKNTIIDYIVLFFTVFFQFFVWIIIAIFAVRFANKNKINYDFGIEGKNLKNVNNFREIPCDKNIFKAFFVADIYSLNKNKNDFMGALLLKWIYDGNAEVETLTEKKLFKDKNEDVITFVSEPANATKEELTLYRYMKEASGDGKLEKDEFKKWCKKNYSKILGWADKVLEAERKALIADGLLTDVVIKKGLVFKYDVHTYRVESKLKQDAIEMKGLKKFLKEFSQINKKEPIEVKLWNEYLMYAQIFGIADQVMKKFKDLYPEIIEDMDNYNFNYNTFVFVHSVSTSGVSAASAARSAAQSYSSGGGGFSSGGGGGGSFGGGGGGGGFR